MTPDGFGLCDGHPGRANSEMLSMNKKMIGVCLFATVTGCASMRAASARNQYIEHTVQQFTYQKPCDEVWAAARTMLFAKDFQVKSADASAGLTLETEWKYNPNGTSSRYLFQGQAPAPTNCQVSVTQATKDSMGQTHMSRDWHMEWNLIKQVDIASAQQIEADASNAGEAARAAN